MVLGRGRAPPRASSSSTPYDAGARRLARARLAALVHGRQDEPDRTTASTGTPHGARDRPAVIWESEDGRVETRHLCRARGRGEPARKRAARARRGQGRRRRPLPADVDPGRGGLLRDRQDRRDRRADLLRLRRAGGRRPAGRCRRRRAAHRRRGAAPGPAGADEGDRRRGRGGGAVGARRGRVVAARTPTRRCSRGATTAGTSSSPRQSPELRRARARPRDADDGDLHVGHDRPAEGRGARARRVPREDRRGVRLPARRRHRTTASSG